ncbi:hypothetical protein AB0N14_38105 [Streptomyces sp. NPDC051104]|uniref:hypothetical protein n=1 Tax=Streptomyces sp. NPDC051104 TaxID=3155044 RepID=UPI00341F8CC1
MHRTAVSMSFGRSGGRQRHEKGWHDLRSSGQGALVSCPAELVSQVSSALVQAGFHVLGDADTGFPGLRVTEVPAGALVSWTASDGFTSLAREQAGRGPSDDDMGAIIQAAVSGLLVQLGHTVAETPDGADLVVLVDKVTGLDSSAR